jgi:ferrous iron transport protein A
MRRRLQDLGLVTGTHVTCLQRASAGDPTAYLIRGAVIALRRDDAVQIEMEVAP